MSAHMLALALAAALTLAAHPANAAPDSTITAPLTVGVHLGTYHKDRAAGYNEVNLGVYVERNGWTAGVYHNSINHPSVYAGYTFQHVVGPLDITLVGVTGYRYAAVIPALIPSVKVGGHLRLSFLLPVEKNGGGVHASWEF